MIDVKISTTNDSFIDKQSGKKFFYLADTVWAAFSNAAITEWEEYLEYRRMQKFNVLQISILPILHDMTESSINILPFSVKPDGVFDYYSINEEYFKRAEAMVEMACKKGFVPALSVLWCCYVPGTRITTEAPKSSRLLISKTFPQYVMPLDAMESYVKYVVKVFSKYNPVYLVSGDTDTGNQDTWKYYIRAAEIIKSMTPDATITMHLGSSAEMPEELIKSQNLDFYMYQSGHRIIEYRGYAYQLAKKYYSMPVKRPILNGEPCYEGHSQVNTNDRHDEFQVRKVIWQSLLSGAKAGFAYGAHGLWGWHRKGSKFNRAMFSGMPYDWKVAMRLKGSWEASFAKYIFESHDLFDIEPVEEIAEDTNPEIRMSAAKDYSKIVIYIPCNSSFKINRELAGYNWTMIVLSEKLFACPEISISEGALTIEMHDYNSDVLIIGHR